MSTTRLTFLYPHLFRSVRISDSAANTVRVRTRAARVQCQVQRGFATSEKRARQSPQRHGKAVEPYPIGNGGDGGTNISKVLNADEGSKEEVKSKERKERKEPDQTPVEAAEEKRPKETASTPLSEEPMPDKIQSTANTDQSDTGSIPDAAALQPSLNTQHETVLEMPPPEMPDQQDAAKPPHLQTPPYVHHFDTYTLVQQVQAGDFTNKQSITAMKAVRALLAHNLEIAKAGLVSKSDVENESYLFRAACSELRTELENQRKSSEETMRRERTLLQHEVDILNQKLTQELLSLKDDLKGMFDDRRMAVRMEQRAMESKIQELNYEITVALNSDSKSEVEGLRWVLTRRSVMAILFMAVMVLTSLRYASYVAHEEELKKKEAVPKQEEKIVDLPAEGAAEILAAN